MRRGGDRRPLRISLLKFLMPGALWVRGKIRRLVPRLGGVWRPRRSAVRVRDGDAMRPFELIAIVIVLTSLFSYINVRLLKLPSTIGLMALSLVFSTAIVVVGSIVPSVEEQARAVARQFDLDQALLHGMLGFLLFAGALHLDLGDLSDHKWPIALMATLGVLISTAIIGGLTWILLGLFGLHLRPIDCLLFGALISPTDPIAVLALLKQIGAPKPLEIQIAGESLFNDGVGVVVFLGLLDIATGRERLQPGFFVELFAREAIGGALFGLVIGLLTYWLLKSVDHFRLEIMLSLAMVAGGYALAEALGLSAPIAMVVAGLLIGNHGRSFAMSATTTEHLDRFWGLLDEFLNAVLFVMIGMEVLVLIFTPKYLLAGLITVAVVLLARLVSVGVPVWLLRRWERFEPSMIPMLTWGGLRGGISVALALSLPNDLGGTTGPTRDIIIAITYVVVVFSILVQGLTIGLMTRVWAHSGAKRLEGGPAFRSFLLATVTGPLEQNASLDDGRSYYLRETRSGSMAVDVSATITQDVFASDPAFQRHVALTSIPLSLEMSSHHPSARIPIGPRTPSPTWDNE